MSLRLLIVLFASSGLLLAQENYDKELNQESNEHMRDELGVNDVTAPSIAEVLKDLGSFQPVPIEVVTSNPLDVMFDNRLQTSLHFGSLVADGFMMTVAERPKDLQDIGRALIRESRALGVGDRLTKRSKSLLEFADKGDWLGMRQELIGTQADVEQSMLDMRDEEMAHMVSLGGWFRGFQIAANSCANNYSADKAKILGNTDIMDYYLDRLDTLHPRLKKTEFVTAIVAKLKEIRNLAGESNNGTPTHDEVRKMKDLANQLFTITITPVDDEGNLIKPAGL